MTGISTFFKMFFIKLTFVALNIYNDYNVFSQVNEQIIIIFFPYIYFEILFVVKK